MCSGACVREGVAYSPRTKTSPDCLNERPCKRIGYRELCSRTWGWVLRLLPPAPRSPCLSRPNPWRGRTSQRTRRPLPRCCPRLERWEFRNCSRSRWRKFCLPSKAPWSRNIGLAGMALYDVEQVPRLSSLTFSSELLNDATCKHNDSWQKMRRCKFSRANAIRPC